MPLTADQLDDFVLQAGTALQVIQNEHGRNNVVAARVRFPRGFIQTAGTHRLQLPNLGTDVQRRNASYGLMTLDVFRWLAVRTDLSGPALSLIVKEAICVIGALCEWLTKEATRGNGSSRPFTTRTARLVTGSVIDAGLKADLDWLWDIRCNEHLHAVASLEHEMYERADYNRALTAFTALRDKLVLLHGAAR